MPRSEYLPVMRAGTPVITTWWSMTILIAGTGAVVAALLARAAT
jgi:hypothetical protein